MKHMYKGALELHQKLDHQQGVQDGISLAYNIGENKLTLQQALQAAVNRNEHYCQGLVEGFQLITPPQEKPTDA